VFYLIDIRQSSSMYIFH